MSAALEFTDDQGQAFWRAAEAAQSVHDRYQLFVWLRLHLHRFIPHDLALMHIQGAPAPAAAAVDDRVQLFYSVPLPEALLGDLPKSRSRWWAHLAEHWSREGRKAVCIALGAASPHAEARALHAAGFESLLVHGIDARSGLQPATLFAFALRGAEGGGAGAARDGREALMGHHMNLWLPTLYCTAVRSLAPRADTAQAAAASAAETRTAGPGDAVLTGRELQIIAAVREAKRNAQIGEALGISPLTVKNHLRKIMRKLGATNRAQAVAEAMSRRLIS